MCPRALDCGLGDMAQMVEHLSSKYHSLRSNPSTDKKKKLYGHTTFCNPFNNWWIFVLFYFLFIINSARKNIHICVYVQNMFPTLLNIYIYVCVHIWLLGQIWQLCLPFWGAARPFSTVAEDILHSSNTWWSHFSTSSPTIFCPF
jgi:hypothetical protein